MFDQKALLPEMQKLRGFALRLTKNATDSEDLVQATLLRALEKRDMFQAGTNLFSWTSKIMFNLFASTYRHNKKFGSQYDPEPLIQKASVAPTQETSTELSIVRETMKRLTTEQRNILVAVCMRGLRYEEVSEMMQIPVGTVRSRLNRARALLTGMLETPGSGRGVIPARARQFRVPTQLTRQYAT